MLALFANWFEFLERKRKGVEMCPTLLIQHSQIHEEFLMS